MTDIIQELRGLIAKATLGNWKVVPNAGKPIIAMPSGGNLFQGYIATWQEADLIVAAINHLPALLDRLEAAERVIDFLDMRRPIKGIERRSNEEVFAIMADRIRLAEAGHYRLPSIREVKP
ncbi:hypothetical protein [Sphingobium yanoikuyae]|uniref:hypothetical protein n=1 Tax=Sphingobium yanoikuyae TaxID=13690 RepID=UPI00345E974F